MNRTILMCPFLPWKKKNVKKKIRKHTIPHKHRITPLTLSTSRVANGLLVLADDVDDGEGCVRLSNGCAGIVMV